MNELADFVSQVLQFYQQKSLKILKNINYKSSSVDSTRLDSIYYYLELLARYQINIIKF